MRDNLNIKCIFQFYMYMYLSDQTELCTERQKKIAQVRPSTRPAGVQLLSNRRRNAHANHSEDGAG